jgi:hypothetical protein
VTAAASWGVSWSAVAVIGVAAVFLHRMNTHGQHVPGWAHPWLSRLLILGMFVGGCAVALTALGNYVLDAEQWVTGLAGGNGSAAAHDVAVVAGVFLLLTVVIGMIWVPAPEVAWFALALPFVAALSGGHLHGVLTVLPVVQWCQEIAHWIGG